MQRAHTSNIINFGKLLTDIKNNFPFFFVRIRAKRRKRRVLGGNAGRNQRNRREGHKRSNVHFNKQTLRYGRNLSRATYYWLVELFELCELFELFAAGGTAEECRSNWRNNRIILYAIHIFLWFGILFVIST